jgi:hypothetical protein
MKEVTLANEKLLIKTHRSNLQDSAKKTLKAGWEVSSLSSAVFSTYISWNNAILMR